MAACKDSSKKDPKAIGLLEGRKVDYIRKIPGKNDSIPEEVVRKGEVLMGYSDCYTCHRDDEKARGPAIRDIAARYPLNQVYIKMLASKVINGGSGAWGYAVMIPHPGLSEGDAEAMVTYILSLDTRP
ncbi:c-type cytochrome [Anseongella ginsenosidimutans]|nr:c-type cytochrome [Anseongella ginsenosidimutans]